MRPARRGEAGDPLPFRCPNAGADDADHLMVRTLDPDRARFPAPDDPLADPNPFVRYRELFHAHHLGPRAGFPMRDTSSCSDELDDAVAAVDGHGFAVTPFGRAGGLSDALGFSAPGGVWVKDETGNVWGRTRPGTSWD